MSTYRQLTYEQRCQIEALNKSGMLQREIAEMIGVSQSSISRELARNTGDRGYRHQQAQRKTVERRQSTHKPYKMTTELIDISHEKIYQHVWENKKMGGGLYLHLRRRGSKYQRRGSNGKTSRGQIKNRISIDERPLSVEMREEVGHWEIDTVIGRGHSGALVTIVERVTRFTVSQRVASKSATDVTAATITLLTPFKKLVHTITSDNGKEFAYHEKISEKLECDFYFAHPYHSWERGLNENTNGLLRQDFPKCTDFREVSAMDVARVVKKLNDRPRKILAFKTPAALMAGEMAALAA